MPNVAAEWLRECACRAKRQGVARNFRLVAAYLEDKIEDLAEARLKMSQEAKILKAQRDRIGVLEEENKQLKTQVPDAAHTRDAADMTEEATSAAALGLGLDGEPLPKEAPASTAAEAATNDDGTPKAVA